MSNALFSHESVNSMVPLDGPMSWMLATAASVILLSLLLAWIASFIFYGHSKSLKKVFPASHNLIRAHIDYLMMATLLGLIYFAALIYTIDIPKIIIILSCFGAVYNPFGFIVKAIKPSAGDANSLGEKLMIFTGFLPVTIGFGYSMILVLIAILG